MPLRGRYYDRQGNPIPIVEFWRRHLTDFERYCLLARDEINGHTISTTWTGLDTGPGPPHQAPLIFETIVVDPANRPAYRERTSTEARALDCHIRAVARVRRGGSFA